MLRSYKRARLTTYRPSSAQPTWAKYRYNKAFKGKMTARKIRKITKKMIVAKKETKRHDWQGGIQNLYHNVSVSQGEMLNRTDKLPTQGNGDGNRDGNDIYGIGWTLRIQLRLPSDRLNAKVRILLLKVPKGYNPLASYGNVMDAITSHVLLDPVDKDRVVVIKDTIIGLHDINPGVPTTGKEVTKYVKYFIPLKKTIKFWDDGAEDNSMPYDFFAVYYAYDTTGSLVTDMVASVQTWSRFTYKDV